MTAKGGASTHWAASVVVLLVPVPFIAVVAYESFVNGVAPPTDLALVVTVVTLGFLELAVVRLQLHPWGVRISKGPWGFPRRTYRREEIASVRAVRVPAIGAALRMRGVGFYCVRTGPALEFTLLDGSHVTVSAGRAALDHVRHAAYESAGTRS